ncbi:rna-directed dna polymerase from mobile element jockey-like [Limosa lapponica baueri]|uniref:Rna-directed dna polymerase from mobile element jockey-like n=1 Tax=Limosa lapponica baueri TaxID=1758121 RepID=A0A2I0U2K6_LIMLA|nr:rna-directed dna polymerase from mobile element jockey-like [Limosa lapponica baueri]
MDHSVHKELAGWPHLNSYSQRLNVHVEASDEWCSSVVGTGTRLLNIFLGEMGSGTECILSKFADDTKLCGTIDKSVLDRRERWTCANLMKFNQAKCKVPHLGLGNSKDKYWWGGEQIESCPAKKNSGVMGDEKVNMS